MKNFAFVWLLFLSIFANAQFAPSVGQLGTTAIFKDSSVFVSWASKATVKRGYLNILDKSLGRVSQGEDFFALGKADNSTVSLGDSGVVVLEFSPPIVNGDSWDFAVFENSFNDLFLELATVEVSSDGENYFMFPAVSLTDTLVQVTSFGSLNASKIHNLAGKYRGGYGTPFDLDSIANYSELDKNNIRFIRITDVVGIVNSSFSVKDSQGNDLNDPFPTPFESGGFDLDAVGVINQRVAKVDEIDSDMALVFPSPAKNIINIRCLECDNYDVMIFNKLGCLMRKGIVRNNDIYNISDFDAGIYFVKLFDSNKNRVFVKSFIKL